MREERERESEERRGERERVRGQRKRRSDETLPPFPIVNGNSLKPSKHAGISSVNNVLI